MCEKGTESTLKHVTGVCFEFTWVGSLVVKICSICEHGSHMAASARLADLDMSARKSKAPHQGVSKSARHLYDQAAVQYFECMHAPLRGNGLLRNTTASSLLCSPCYFGMSAKRGSKNTATKHKTGPSSVTCSKNKLIERCGIPASSTPRQPAARRDFQPATGRRGHVSLC